MAAGALALSLNCSATHALTLLPDAAFVQAALSSGQPDTIATDLGMQWHWSRRWHWSQTLRLSGFVELALGRWAPAMEDRSSDPTWITQVTIAPVLRWSGPSETGWYFELGIGPSWLNPVYRSVHTQFSSRFQFRDHLGVGKRWGERGQHDLGLRFVHFSNANLELPNPGVNFLALRYTLHF